VTHVQILNAIGYSYRQSCQPVGFTVGDNPLVQWAVAVPTLAIGRRIVRRRRSMPVRSAWVPFAAQVIAVSVLLAACDVIPMASRQVLLRHSAILPSNFATPPDTFCAVAGSCTAGMICSASFFPNSTPHWSKELIPQITPWVNTLCS
jgi:hypothetical protein